VEKSCQVLQSCNNITEIQHAIWSKKVKSHTDKLVEVKSDLQNIHVRLRKLKERAAKKKIEMATVGLPGEEGDGKYPDTSTN